MTDADLNALPPHTTCATTRLTLYKNKGNRSDYNNYCGTSLLSIVGKAVPKAVQHSHLLPRGYTQHSMLQRGNLRRLPIQQWSEARLCPGTNPLTLFGNIFSVFLKYAFDDSLRASASATEQKGSSSTSPACAAKQKGGWSSYANCLC